MRDRKKSTPSSSNVFSPTFLEILSELPRPESSTVAEAENAGPWSVIKRSDGFFVEKEGSSEVKAVFTLHDTAYLVAAILPSIGRTIRYRRAPQDDDHGAIVEVLQGTRYVRVGSMHGYYDEILEALHVAECLLRSPACLALFLQAASFESLEPAGGIVAGRILS